MSFADSLSDAITSGWNSLTSMASAATTAAVNALPEGQNAQYQFSYDVFPEDLGSSQYGHFMTITAIVGDKIVTTPTGPISPAPPNRAAYTVGMFIPSGESGTGIIYEQKHEYADVKLANLMGSAIAAFAGGSAGGSDPSLVTSYFGHPINPGVEVLFRHTNLRQFQFAFLMAPSSQKESESMKNIVQKLRMFAAPELNNTTGGIFFNTPAEFEIKFYNKGVENTNIPKIRRCVLTDIMVNYTPEGEWSTFRNGHPVTCQLALTFQEMEIIHRQFIRDGY